MNACAFSEQACGQNPRVVQHHELIAMQQLRQFRKYAILPRAALAIEQQHPRGFATLRGALRDQLAWQLVVKCVDSHQPETITKQAICEVKYPRKISIGRNGLKQIASIPSSIILHTKHLANGQQVRNKT